MRRILSISSRYKKVINKLMEMDYAWSTKFCYTGQWVHYIKILTAGKSPKNHQEKFSWRLDNRQQTVAPSGAR